MDKRIRILTYHNVPNNGAVLQNYALQHGLRKILPEYDIATLDYIPREIKLAELLKFVKFYKKVPLFNLQRYIVFWKFIYLQKNLTLDRRIPLKKNFHSMKNFLEKKKFDALIIGSDNIWKITSKKWNPPFPNIYWTPSSVRSKKYSFAASAYNSEPEIVKNQKDYIKDVLEHFSLISARDSFTYDLAKDIQKRTPVYKIPDPTFMMDIPSTNVKEKLLKRGIDLDKPTVAILLYKDDVFTKDVCDFFRQKGYQILALSMYNSNADFNLGHVLDPLEWADIFKYLKFAVTDRFHGTIFCLKNHTPFICVEPKDLPDYKKESKIYSLLNDFNMTENHLQIYDKGFTRDDFIKRYEEVVKNFDIGEIDRHLSEMRNLCFNFIDKIKEDLER